MKNLTTFQAVVINEKGAFKNLNGRTFTGKSQFNQISLLIPEFGGDRWADFNLKNIIFVNVDELISKNAENAQFIELIAEWRKAHKF